MNINKKINILFGAVALIAMVAAALLVFYLALFAPL